MGKKIILIILILALIVSGVIFVRQQNKKLAVDEDIAGTSEHAEKEQTSLFYEDREYPLKHHITSLLVLGTDKFEGQLYHGDIDLFYNESCADFQTVLVIDDDEKAIYAIPVNRDTVTAVPWLDVLGNIGGYVEQQIALAYTYGSGKKDSAENDALAVSKFLYDAPIDYVMAFTMDSVPIINDAVGGVEVTIETDLTGADPSFKKGETLTLMGDKALTFVRARMNVGDESNLQRMGRFKQYLYGFIVSARRTYNKNPDSALKILEKVSPYLTMNMTAEKLSEITKKLAQYELKPFKSIDGEVKINEYAEFYADDESKWNAVKDVYCIGS